MSVLNPAVAFDTAFAACAARHVVRPETRADRAFLVDLFAAVSPLRDLLPPALLAQQADAADAHFRTAFPNAMRRIVARDGAPVGRIIIDWTPADQVIGVDIAVLPETKGVGLAMLRAWLAIADRLARPCHLTVVKANPAQGIYKRLGFREAEGEPDAPMVSMIRPAQSRAAIHSH